jgi:hypothetical protein
VVNSRLGHAPYLLGLVAYERNLLDEAEAHFRRVEDLRYLVISGIFRDALIGRALVALARDDQEGSIRTAGTPAPSRPRSATRTPSASSDPSRCASRSSAAFRLPRGWPPLPPTTTSRSGSRCRR